MGGGESVPSSACVLGHLPPLLQVGNAPRIISFPKKIRLMKDSREGLSPALNLPSVLEVLLHHAHYTVDEIRIEALRWLLWLQEKIPKRVSWAQWVWGSKVTPSFLLWLGVPPWEGDFGKCHGHPQ